MAEAKSFTDCKVHFPSEQASEQSDINVQYLDNEIIHVHIGFLQIYRQYEISFSLKDNLSEDLTFDPLENLHCKVLNVMPTEDGEGHNVMVDFSAHKEKIIKETLTLMGTEDPQKKLTLILHARVLGNGKGTPSLKTGVRLTGINADEDSEQSDWQGFD